jgi:carbonic anhydrase
VGSIDEALHSNQAYAQNFRLGDLAKPPARRLAVIACMDARMSIEAMLGLKTGDAHIIRNAGGIVSDDALRSLIISHHLLGTSEFMIINHTDCGMMGFRDDELRSRLQEETGGYPLAPERFYAFTDVEENVRMQMRKLRLHPWIPKSIPVRGFVYDVSTGRLNEVLPHRAAVAED